MAPLCTRPGGEILVPSVTDEGATATSRELEVFEWKGYLVQTCGDEPEMVTVQINVDPVVGTPGSGRATGAGSLQYTDPFTSAILESYLKTTDTLEGLRAKIEWAVYTQDGNPAMGDSAIVDIDQGVVLTVPANYVKVKAISTRPSLFYPVAGQGGQPDATVPPVRVRGLIGRGEKAYGVSHTARLTIPVGASIDIGGAAQVSPTLAIPRHAVAATIVASSATVAASANIRFNQLVNPNPNLILTPIVTSPIAGANRPLSTDTATFPIVNGARFFFIEMGNVAFLSSQFRVVFYLSI